MIQSKMKLLFTGGGTGGHVLPIVALVREIRKLSQKESPQFFYMGPKDDFGQLLLSQEGMKTAKVFAGKLRRYSGIKPILQNIVDVCFFIPLGVLCALWKLFFLAPDLIFSKGGYGALPVTLASWFLRIPVFLHESDSVAGFANRIGAHFCAKLFCAFPRTKNLPLEKTTVVGNPVRIEILEGSNAEAKELFALQGEKPLVLILGGSQGAQTINDVLLIVLNEVLDMCEVIHQTGEKNFSQVCAEAHAVVPKEKQGLYHPRPFLAENELKHAYAMARVVVSRAGAGSLFEIAALGKPSLIIPLPDSAQNHQIENAYAYTTTGAGSVIEESNLSPHFFLEKLRYLLENPQELERMSQAALKFARPNAARIIAEYVLEYLN